MNSKWNVSTYPLRVHIGRARSVWNEQPMEWGNVRPESSHWSKRGQYAINRKWNGSTYQLRVQIGRVWASSNCSKPGQYG